MFFVPIFFFIYFRKKKWSYNETKSTIYLLNVCMQVFFPTLDIQRIWERVLGLAQGQASGVAGLLASAVAQLVWCWDAVAQASGTCMPPTPSCRCCCHGVRTAGHCLNEILENVHKRIRCACSRSQSCSSSSRLFAVLVGVCQIIDCCSFWVGGFRNVFSK